MVIDITDLSEGQYAVAVYQDNNDNGRLDKNFFGSPTEKYGFSNNSYTPNYGRCLFNFDNDLTITIRIE